MNFDLNKLGKTASVLFLALAMAGCGGGGSDTAEMVPEPEPMVPEPVPPTDAELAIAAAQTAAAAAATAAQTAADAAEVAAAAAEAASMNRAIIQTGEANSGTASAAARTHADAAAAAAAAAMAQSAAAAAATDVTVAVAAKVAAEAAQALAEAAQPMAESYQAMAATDAMSELMIDGKTKSVGESTLTIDDRAVTDTTTPAVPDKTGFQSKLSFASAAVTRVAVDDTNTAINEIRTGVASRPIAIGFVYDSSDDMARVNLVHSYRTFQRNARIITGFLPPLVPASASKNTVTLSSTNTSDLLVTAPVATVVATLTPVAGVFYQVNTTASTIALGLGAIGATTKATPVYSYSYTNTAGATVTVPVALTATTVTSAGATTYTYSPIVEGTLQTNPGFSTANVPVAAMYEHIHFGLWTDLADNAFVAGANTIASRGIGFVADAGGEGMTADMPVFGDATYNGNWVAAVQAAHPAGTGGIRTRNGLATMAAHFGRNTVAVTLNGLASLSGNISGNTFSGDSVPTGVDSGLGLASTGSFSGTLSGAFFGPQAAEAGGVFDYDSVASISGAFRGAFGGARTPDTVIE